MCPYTDVYETGFRLLEIRQEESERVLFYTLRFGEAMRSFQAAVERAAPGRSPWDLLRLVLFQKGLNPDVQRLYLMQPPAETMADAVSRAQRCERALNEFLPARGARAESFTPRPRPFCTYRGCRKPVGHTAKRCFQRLRERKRRGGSKGGRGGKRAKKKLRSGS